MIVPVAVATAAGRVRPPTASQLAWSATGVIVAVTLALPGTEPATYVALKSPVALLWPAAPSAPSVTSSIERVGATPATGLPKASVTLPLTITVVFGSAARLLTVTLYFSPTTCAAMTSLTVTVLPSLVAVIVAAPGLVKTA